MPWDGCELWVGELGDDGLLTGQPVARGRRRSGVDLSTGMVAGRRALFCERHERLVEPATASRARARSKVCTRRKASWACRNGFLVCRVTPLFRQSRLRVVTSNRAFQRLASIDTRTGKLTHVDCPFTDIQYVRAHGGEVVFRGGSPTEVLSIVKYNVERDAFETLRRSNELEIYPRFFSVPRAIEFPTEGGLTAHGFFYPPQNPDFRAPENEKPPLIVKSHGGPTAAASTALSLSIQYWTSSGFAVLDVNYGGSTGYGRAISQAIEQEVGHRRR